MQTTFSNHIFLMQNGYKTHKIKSVEKKNNNKKENPLSCQFFHTLKKWIFKNVTYLSQYSHPSPSIYRMMQFCKDQKRDTGWTERALDFCFR